MLNEEFHDKIKQLQDMGESGFVAVVSEADDLDMLSDGSLDALFRPRIKSHPGFHLDQLDFSISDGNIQSITLAMMPGIAGCREHQLLLKALAQTEV